jgi:DNA-binding response OmpR family regulator/DNA-binding CsgD family transcriptional regulator
MSPDRTFDEQVAPDSMSDAGVVLIVDDAPENLAMLHEALDVAGYRVLVATDGQVALDRVARLMPDVILLDALMPGLDGFETCRRLKADPASAHIPVVFMTGLTDTDHILHGFRAGGVDYVTKPLKPSEVLARIATHLRNARLAAHAQQAVDATGHALLSVDRGGKVAWQSPTARRWLQPLLEADGRLPPLMTAWLQGLPEAGEGEPLRLLAGSVHLSLSRLASDPGSTTLLLRKRAGAPEPAVLMARFALTAREAEVVYWVACGKTNRDVGDILHMSPRTVDKHLQHVFAKLNVETRTAAASVVLNETGGRPRGEA